MNFRILKHKNHTQIQNPTIIQIITKGVDSKITIIKTNITTTSRDRIDSTLIEIGVTTIIIIIIIQEIIIILKLFKTIKDRVTKVLRVPMFPKNVPEFQIQINNVSLSQWTHLKIFRQQPRTKHHSHKN